MKPIFCTCCGEPITKPKFYNRLPYGSSCFEKVTGRKASKQEFPKGIFIKADRVELDEENKKIRAYVGDTIFSDFHREGMKGMESRNIINNLIRVSEFNNGTKSLWKHVMVIQERTLDGKLIPLKVVNKKTSEIISIL